MEENEEIGRIENLVRRKIDFGKLKNLIITESRAMRMERTNKKGAEKRVAGKRQ